jgi:twitching motility protein PilI
MRPSEVLNREFILADIPQPDQQVGDGETRGITAHAVLVGNIGLLLPRREVSELVENQAICQLPNTSTWFNGVTSVRGNMIPIFDLHKLFDIGHEGKRRRMIVVGEAEKAVAFWVDEMPRMVSVGEDDVMNSAPPIPSLIKDHSQQYFLKDGQIWIDWDVRAFFMALGKLI